MIAEVISIGDELTSGQRLDTNSQWLSERLGELGFRVMYHTTVADDLAANVAVFRAALLRADVVLATGGLGPTADDLTREALAAAIGVGLMLDEPSLEHIRRLFARFQRDMPERNRLQAMFPEGSRPIFNPNGTAPGIYLEAPHPSGGACRVFALPGVPAEMHEMFGQTVAPLLAGLSGRPRVIRHHRIKVFGAGESHVEAMLPDLIRRGRVPAVGITVHAATITLRITAEGATPEECDTAMQPTIDAIYKSLGGLIYGEEDDELQDVVVDMLFERGQTLATAEIGTHGLLAHWLSEAREHQGSFRGGVVRALPAGGELAASSAEAAEALAMEARQMFGADYGLAVGPFPVQTPDAEPAAYHFALAGGQKAIVRSGTLASHPSIWKPRAAKQALNLLRLALIERGT